MESGYVVNSIAKHKLFSYVGLVSNVSVQTTTSNKSNKKDCINESSGQWW